MTDEPSGLREAAVRGVRWIAGARVVIEIFALVASIVLARLIPPEAFGRAAVALVIVALSIIIGPAGVSAVVVQRRDLSDDQVAATAFLGYALGLALSGATLVGGLTVGASLFGEATGELIALASPGWTLTAMGGVSQALMQRRLDFRSIAMRDSLAALAGTATAVTLAIVGFDAGALLLGALVVVGVTALASVAVAPQPVAVPKPEALRQVLGFAGSVSLSSIVYTLYTNVDYVILGLRLSAREVGYYFRAFQLGVEYQGKLSGIMIRVSFPVFSRAADMAQLRRARAAIVRTHATVLLPLLAAFVALAPDVIPFLYGSAWEGAVLPAQILAGGGMAYAVTTGTGPLLIALGRANALLVWNLVELVVYTAMVATLSGFGLVPVAVGVAVFAASTVFVIQFFLLGPIVGLPLVQLWHDIRAGLAAAALVVAACLPLQHVLDPGVPTVPRILVVGSAAVVVTAALYVSLFKEAMRDVLEVVPLRKLLRRASRRSGAA